jgi:hypothetical protein
MGKNDDFKRVSLEGRTYSWTGKTWVDVETFTYPPTATINKLTATLLSKLKEEDEKITDVRQLLARARDAKAQTQYIRAEGLARKALQMSPGNLHALSVLCSILRHLGKPEEVLKESEPYKDENHPPINTSRAAALCDLRRWEEAKTELSKSLSISKKHSSWVYDEPFRVLTRIKSARPDLFRGKSG